MRLTLSKIIALAIFAFCFIYGWNKVADQMRSLLEVPRKTVAAMEIKQIDRLILGLLAGSERDASLVMEDFCRENLEQKGSRKPWVDNWGRHYRIYLRGLLYHEHYRVTLNYEDDDKFMVVSAGPDQYYVTEDDLVSRAPSEPVCKWYGSWLEKEAGKDPAAQPYNE